MELLLIGTALLWFGVPGTASPLLETPSAVAPRDVARVAVEAYNQATGTQAVFRLLKIKNTHKTRFDWGVHFSLNFTIKETACQKTGNYRIGNCKYKIGGSTRDCSAEVSVLNFMDDTPLTSVTCNSLQRAKKAKPGSRVQPAMDSPRGHVEPYYPSSYSTAALQAPEGGE